MNNEGQMNNFSYEVIMKIWIISFGWWFEMNKEKY